MHEVNKIRINRNALLVIVALLLLTIHVTIQALSKAIWFYNVWFSIPILLFCIWTAAKFTKGGIFNESYDRLLIFFGIVFCLGAHLSDLVGTYIYLPDLFFEANPNVRMLLHEYRFPLGFVWAFLIIFKICLGVFGSLLWVGIVGHRHIIINWPANIKANYTSHYFKAAKMAITGSYHLNEWPKPFNLAFLFAIFFVSLDINTWSTWLLPNMRFYGLLGLEGFLLGFVIWLTINYNAFEKSEKENKLIGTLESKGREAKSGLSALMIFLSAILLANIITLFLPILFKYSNTFISLTFCFLLICFAVWRLIQYGSLCKIGGHIRILF